jgi:hypothetical protein
VAAVAHPPCRRGVVLLLRLLLARIHVDVVVVRNHGLVLAAALRAFLCELVKRLRARVAVVFNVAVGAGRSALEEHSGKKEKSCGGPSTSVSIYALAEQAQSRFPYKSARVVGVSELVPVIVGAVAGPELLSGGLGMI